MRWKVIQTIRIRLKSICCEFPPSSDPLCRLHKGVGYRDTHRILHVSVYNICTQNFYLWWSKLTVIGCPVSHLPYFISLSLIGDNSLRNLLHLSSHLSQSYREIIRDSAKPRFPDTPYIFRSYSLFIYNRSGAKRSPYDHGVVLFIPGSVTVLGKLQIDEKNRAYSSYRHN